MSSVLLPPGSLSQNPFLELGQKDQTEVIRSLGAVLKTQGAFDQTRSIFTEAKNVMEGKNASLPSHNANNAIKFLNQEAEKKLIPIKNNQFIQGWKGQQSSITNLSFVLERMGKCCFPCGLGVASLGLWHLRSQKILALANGVMACALSAIYFVSLRWSQSASNQAKIIEDLTCQNIDQFSNQMDESYKELEKTSVLSRVYLQAHKKKMETSHQGLILLQQQLSAFQEIQKLGFNLILKFRMKQAGVSLPSMDIFNDQTQPVDLQQIKLFFENFEKICRAGKWTFAGANLITLALTYHAYVQRAYFMIVAGIVHFVAQSLLGIEFWTLQRGSKKIKNASDDQAVIQEFQVMAKKSNLLSLLDLQTATASQISSAVVIPFDAILKLIPSWPKERSKI